jgi:hypothetical protein
MAGARCGIPLRLMCPGTNMKETKRGVAALTSIGVVAAPAPREGLG